MSHPAQPARRKRLIFGLFCCFSLIVAGCSADTAFIDFATFTRVTTPNDTLACPEALCAAKSDLVTDMVALPATALADKVAAELPQEVRTDIVARSADGLRFVLVQRSLIFRFPDTVNISVQEIDAGHSSLAIYSRSNYGHGDLGVNRKRVETWLTRLGVPYRVTP